MDELISIIVPVYNAEKYIEETIACVAAQTYEDWELLLVDDCGTDGTLKAIKRYMDNTRDPRICLIRQPSNQGAARARNRGLQEAKGRYIAYLDADDLWVPEKLERELAYMKEKDAAFVFTGGRTSWKRSLLFCRKSRRDLCLRDMNLRTSRAEAAEGWSMCLRHFTTDRHWAIPQFLLPR